MLNNLFFVGLGLMPPGPKLNNIDILRRMVQKFKVSSCGCGNLGGRLGYVSSSCRVDAKGGLCIAMAGVVLLDVQRQMVQG